MIDDAHRASRGSLFRDQSGARPTGEVAFLFTDLQGSTTAWEREPQAMNDVLARHDETLRSAIEASRGAVFSVAGDAFGAGFHTVEEAVRCAVDAQQELARQTWPSGLAPRVRMGLHVGRAFERDLNYFGPTVNRAARVMSAAHGGQILLTDEAVTLLGGAPAGVTVERLGRFQLKDLPEPIGLHQLVIEELGGDFPPLLAFPESPRIQKPSSAFIGRGHELSHLSLLLATNRAVTVVAAGGTGKTRLALEAAAAVSHRFPHGAVAVELADGGLDDVIPRLADAVLGADATAKTEAGTDLLPAVLRHIGGGRALILLDNCEHVLAAVAAVVEALITACPRVVVLATSRERLALAAERVVPLSPLSWQRVEGGVSPAAELFMDRALGANPAIEMDAATLDAIDAICSAVEGSALGIELAAARVRSLTPRQVAERLGVNLRLLRQRQSGAPERHRSLEAAIAWSFDMLDEDEQRLLAWCAVFVGGLDLAAAETLAQAAGIGDPIDIVESLVDKCLLTAQPVGATMRYRMAEPIRQFAGDRLDQFAEREQAVDAHFQHCRAAARRAVSQLEGHVDPPLFVSLSTEVDNYLAAIHRADRRGDRKAAMALAGSLDLYWAETGRVGVAMQLFDSLARRDPDHPDTALVHVPLLWVATMAGELPRAQEVRGIIEAQLAEGGLNPLSAGGALFGFGFVESACGDGMAAAKAWSLAARSAERVVPALARQAYWSAGQSATAAGDQELALGLYAAADRLDGPAPGWWPPFVDTMRRVSRTYQGERHVEQLDAGAAALEDSGLRMRFVLASAFVSLALFHADAPERAEHWWRRSITISREVGNLWACWVMLECAAWSAAERAEDLLAARLWHAVDSFGVQRGYGLWPVVADGRVARRSAAAVRSAEVFASVAHERPWTLTDAVEAALTPRGEP